MIKNREWLGEIEQLHQQVEESQVVTACLPLVSDLYIVFALDCGQQIQYLDTDALASYSSSNDVQEVYQHALENLKNQFEQAFSVQAVDAGYRIVLDSNYDASLALLDIPWKEQLDLQGEPVFALIARGTLVIADSANPQQIAKLKAMAKQLYDDVAYRISPDLFVFKKEKLTLFGYALN